jgi:hypothetical protein
MMYGNMDDVLETMRPSLRERVLEVTEATRKVMNGEPLEPVELVINRISQEAIDTYWKDVLKHT